MDIGKVTFPLYKLRSYLSIDTNPLGLVKVTTIKGVYILDDKSYNGTFAERRIKISMHTPTKIYKLKEKVIYLRQLVKYKSGTTFIDLNGNIIKYRKSTKLFKVISHKIERVNEQENWSIIHCTGLEQPLLVGTNIGPEVKYVSIMETQWGPFLYDLTNTQHDTYRRKL